jgi:hypothetical protein
MHLGKLRRRGILNIGVYWQSDTVLVVNEPFQVHESINRFRSGDKYFLFQRL